MNNDYNEIFTRLTQLDGPALLVAFLLMLGYGLKVTSLFPNKYIPRAIMIAGPGLSPFVIGLSDPGEVSHRIPYPVVAIWLQALCRGFIFASVTWMAHHAAIRKIEQKLGSLFGEKKIEPGSMSESEKTAIAKETQ